MVHRNGEFARSFIVCSCMQSDRMQSIVFTLDICCPDQFLIYLIFAPKVKYKVISNVLYLSFVSC